MSRRQYEHSEDFSADGSQSAHGEKAGGDCAQRVFALAPYWVYTHLWHMERHCVSPGYAICFSCPLTSDEMLKLYREHQLKGSNLIVGLNAETASRHGGQDIPPAFLRTLAYMFELVKKGLRYSPVAETDILAGMPELSWAPTLWPTAPADSSVSIGTDPVQLFQAAPFWCYLYTHEPQRSKKTPPKTASQMVDMYMSESLPLWIPVLALEAEVARFNSLPPCLFMTLGSIIAMMEAGLSIKPIGLRELQRYDKFIGNRSASGNTKALPLVSQDSGGAHTSVSHPMPPYPSPTHNISAHSSGSLGHLPQPKPNNNHNFAWQSSRMHGASNGDAPASFHVIPPSPGSSSVARSNSDASGNWGHSAHTSACQIGGHASSMSSCSQHRRLHSNSVSVACSPAFPPAPLAPLSTMSSPASPHNVLFTPSYPAPIPWQTALFKLFTSDPSRGRFQPLWWYLDLCSPSGMHGPITAEHMIIGFLQGTLGESSMVCGVTSECNATHRPAYDSFEPIGVLLEKINQGGHYVLVTLNEMLGLPPAAAHTPYPSLPTYNPAPAPLPTYNPPASAPLPTHNSQPNLPAYNMVPHSPYAQSLPAGSPLPTYNPSPSSIIVPENSRMVHQQQQQSSRGVVGSMTGIVGAPPPHGLPPTHHPLSSPILNSLRYSQQRYKSHSTSRTSLASSMDHLVGGARPHVQQQQQQQQPFQQENATTQNHSDYYPLQQTVGPRSRSSMDSSSSGFPGNVDNRGSPTLSPPSEAMQPTIAESLASQGSQQQQQGRGGMHVEEPLQNGARPAASEVSVVAKVALNGGQKAESMPGTKHVSEQTQKSESAGEQDHLACKKQPAAFGACAGNTEQQPVMSLST